MDWSEHLIKIKELTRQIEDAANKRQFDKARMLAVELIGCARITEETIYSIQKGMEK